METLMSNAKPLDLSLPYQVADISLADFGKSLIIKHSKFTDCLLTC